MYRNRPNHELVDIEKICGQPDSLEIKKNRKGQQASAESLIDSAFPQSGIGWKQLQLYRNTSQVALKRKNHSLLKSPSEPDGFQEMALENEAATRNS